MKKYIFVVRQHTHDFRICELVGISNSDQWINDIRLARQKKLHSFIHDSFYEPDDVHGNYKKETSLKTLFDDIDNQMNAFYEKKDSRHAALLNDILSKARERNNDKTLDWNKEEFKGGLYIIYEKKYTFLQVSGRVPYTFSAVGIDNTWEYRRGFTNPFKALWYWIKTFNIKTNN